MKEPSGIPYDGMLTTNEIKDLLSMYITPFRDMCIRTSEQSEVKISKGRAISLMLDKLSKVQLNELINQLYLMRKKRQNELCYIQYILIAILGRERQTG
ncbi:MULTISPECIES: hypothetical protein [Bacillus]|uniref:hypothetical protein n=1 Tax=Bacillus TaxID=1386 RepID=UPI000C773EEA|nr:MULTISPECIES: hypothetical protein [Bacillus]PLR73744.1 hypothetical protein CYJ37_09500 [Bacillus sp. UMB0728]RYI27974.1 hypothetical protein EVU96_16120 [Bacillus infantis]